MMAAKSTRAPARRKTNSVSLPANVVQIDSETRKARNQAAYNQFLKNYLMQFTERERDIALDFLHLAITNAGMIRNDKPEHSEVIPFPAIKKQVEA